MRIDNRTGYALSVTQIYVEWNHDKGHQTGGESILRLRQIALASQIWDGDINSPSAYIPTFFPTIPPGESLVQFIFHQNYDLRDGTERIIITLGTPGCVNYPIDSRQ